jgi:serine/threonine protein kinase/Tol biopolymer transport system component
MPLKPGTRLGPYEIESSLGAGGMGEVYRARDTRLDRAVAVKVLPAHLADDPARRARFEREARAVSSLNHPHIGQLYDVGRENGVDYLVLELLEGETLAHRLEKGPLPSAQVIQYGIQIADALDRAHKSGIVHRDLKPGNIMITRGGVKLLDFGLARAVEAVTGPQALTLSPTAPAPLTAEGTILGTFQYMAPEQLEGKEADARTDIFALGEILYEMATGRRAFEGKSQASLIAAILERDPAPISAIAPLTPPALERVVRACLAKDPDERIQTAHDVKLQLQWIAEGGSSVGVPAVVATKRKSRERLAWILAGASTFVALVLLTALATRHPPDLKPVRFQIEKPAGTSDMTWPRLSPDGRWVAFQANDSAGKTSIWVRGMDALDARRLDGTEGASRPFWAPSSRDIGFFADNKLKKVPVDGGPVQLIADAKGADGSWGAQGVILYDYTQADSIMQVSASGGIPKPASSFDRNLKESGHAWPQFLPDGKHFLFVSLSGTESRLKVGELGSFHSKLIRDTASRGEYAPGHLVYVLDNNLVAQPFDLGQLKLSGDPVPIAERVNLLGGRENFSTSQAGTIAFQSGVDIPGSELVWIDRSGHVLSRVGAPDNYSDLALSPDDKKVAVAIDEGGGKSPNIWIIDLERGTRSRFTFDESDHVWPVWSPDGQWIAYASDSGGVFRPMRKRADSGDRGEYVTAPSGSNEGIGAWSPDGHTLLTQIYRDGNWDVDMVDLASGKRTPFLHSKFNEFHPRISPDGKWVTYSSDENGRNEVFVSPFPGPSGKWQVSLSGGRAPRWSPDGREIFFISGNGPLMVASISTAPRFQSGEPKPLFTAHSPATGFPQDRVLPARDGKRLLANLQTGGEPRTPITVIVNWLGGSQK